ncbi:K02A2.6-like [Cordylochernes scorpioides]|uniref:K02A2.6-like n=1 Tax=Cordylochernes scorpioides TaxID=51811 RepID=A0ABY6L6V7_9ARAC|nr:K02A2.6-like [Cordylochernes scorpioides]
MPRYLDSKALQEREKRRMINQKRLYDKRHDVHSLPELQQGDGVRIIDQRVEGKVLHKSQEPRSYWVQTPQGKNSQKWIKMFEKVAKYNKWDETQSLANVVFYLEGTAAQWFDNNEDIIISWTQFKKNFCEVFGQK